MQVIKDYTAFYYIRQIVSQLVCLNVCELMTYDKAKPFKTN
jgi:hypothetical protein